MGGKGRNASFVLALFLLLPVAYGAEPVVARYVRIDLPGDGRVLSLAEVQVYSGEKLISLLGKARQPTTFNNATADKAIDGKTSGAFSEGSVSHTESGSYIWWELDLGADQEITKIVIYNRTDCCAERINPAHIALRNNAQKIVWQDNIETTLSRYSFDVTQASTSLTPIGRNLLRNATFRQSTNPPLPDYWDLHHAAALTFKDLYGHYGVDVNATAPLPGVDVLKIINSEENFWFLILKPTGIQSVLPGGDYTYSVYVKANRKDAFFIFNKAWAAEHGVTQKVSTSWQRYKFTFKERGGASSLQPIMYFPKKATYFVAAPQLEEGSMATPFDAGDGGGTHLSTPQLATQKLERWVSSKLKAEPNGGVPTGRVQSMVEYDYYTSHDSARLWLSSSYSVDINADVACENLMTEENVFFRKHVRLSPKSAMYVEVPIKTLPPGFHRCNVNSYGRGVRAAISNVYIKKLSSSPLEVRTNTVRRFFTINDVPFYIVGIYAEPSGLPDWYFKDIKEHGINTLFNFQYPNRNGEYDLQSIKSVLTAAAKYNLKVIVGLPIGGGVKPADWRRKISKFLALIDQLKEYPQIIGWYPVDEPDVNTWQDGELIEIYNSIKRADPYRFVFVTWSGNRVAGQQPLGALGATDIYAFDYYPFTIPLSPSVNLDGFTKTASGVALTANLYNKPFLTWLQIYGGNEAYREPTGAELNYMAYTNFIYGGMISYWEVKSNSAATWEKLRIINQQGEALAQKLFYSESAYQLLPPVATEKFLYTAWKKGKNIFLIVLNRDAVSSRFLYDVSSITREASEFLVHSIFEDRSVKLVNGRIDEGLAPYESKVYEIIPQ